MKKFIKKICHNISDRYSQDKNVLGVMLFGSAAQETFDKYSDIDIFILLNRKGAFTRTNFVENGVRVDIIFNTVREVIHFLKEDRGSVRRITSHMLAHGRILFQSDNKLQRTQLIAHKNLTLKTKVKRSEVLMHLYSIDDFWGEVQRDIEKKNFLAFGLDSQLLINNILELFLKLHGGFLQQPNRMIEVLHALDRQLADRMENFYKVSDIKRKKRILAELVKYIYKKSGGSLPKRWSLRN